MKNSDTLVLGSKPAPGDLAYVQGFVNTVDLESGRDELATRTGVGRWLERHGFVAPGLTVSEGDRERTVAFREALRALLFTNHGEALDPAALRTLNDAAASAPLHVTFVATGAARLEPAAAGVDAGLAMLAGLVYDAMREGTWERLKACRSDSCQWAFYDASRNRSGAWCSMATCGNRNKVEAHRKRTAKGE